MHAHPGEGLVVKGYEAGAPDHDARVLEVRGSGAAPSFLVERFADGHVDRGELR